MKLEILTPEKTLFRGEVETITLPGTMGSFQVLNNHAPLIAALEKGVLSYTVGNDSIEMVIEDGIVEVHDNRVVVCIEKGENIIQ